MSEVKKELVIESNGFMRFVRWKGGGEVPVALSGFYTSQAEAQKAIDDYLSTRRTRKKSDGKSKSRA